MSLKENFYQALRELLNYGGLVGSDLEEKSRAGGSDLDAYLETPRVSPAQEQQPEPAAAPEPEPVRSRQEQPSRAQERREDARQEPEEDEEIFDSARTTARRQPDREEQPYRETRQQGYRQPLTNSEPVRWQESEELTIISKNTLVDGNIRSFANVRIEGSVRGRVDVMKDAAITGTLLGNLTCSNAEMQGSSVEGDVFTKGRIFVDNDSLLLGNMTAQYANVDGKIRGNMDVSGKVELHSNAVIAGDIKTGTISVADGANILGYVSTAYLAENNETAFPSRVTIDEELEN